jgi:hypothetical protein
VRVTPSRRSLVLGASALPLLGRGAAAQSAGGAARRVIRFRVMREGSAIGTHVVTITDAEDGSRTARTDVDIAVRFAGLTVFRYTHRFVETWRDGRVVRVASRTERQGKVTPMEARAEGDALVVTGPDGPRRLPAEAAPLSWWDPATLTRPLFEANAGRLLRVRAERLPWRDGGFRWRLSGEAEGEGFYDAAGAWVAHAMHGEDGSVVTYERM